MPVFRLPKEIVFPNPELADREGLIAVGGDLSPRRLVAAYCCGIFPWFSEGDPILWFSPDPRMVLYPAEFKLSDSLRRLVASGKFELRIDHSFAEVIGHCAAVPRPGQQGTWITADMREAYIELHELGLAHSFECYRDGSLVGGLYGVSLGAAFFGESMFHLERDASKFALAGLVAFATRNRFAFIDAQQPTKHLRSLGAREVVRKQFIQQLNTALDNETLQGSWAKLDADPAT